MVGRIRRERRGTSAMIENKWKLIDKLIEMELVYSEHANNEIKVDKVSIWMAKEKWYDAETGEKGMGVNSFISHISKKFKF